MFEQFEWMNKNVLVTGGAGFLGSFLVERLVDEGAEVTVVDDISSGSIKNLERVMNRINFQRLDIRQISWAPIIRENHIDLIFHLAANAYVPPSVENPAWDYQINLEGTFRLLEALRKLEYSGLLINASSGAVYGNPIRLPIQEDDPTCPISPYGVAKLSGERYLSVYSQIYGLKALSLRFFSLYGPRQYKQVVYDLSKKLTKLSSELVIYGDGSQVRDFTYVEDAVQSIMLTAERAPAQGEVYNVASGCGYSIGELVEILCSVLNVSPRLIYSGSVRPGDPEKWSVDINRLSSLGYLPQVSFNEGLKRTAKWVQLTHNKEKSNCSEILSNPVPQFEHGDPQ